MLKNKPSLLFYFLLIIFVIPIIFAWYAFQHPTYWIKRTTNHGILLNPVKSLMAWPLLDNHQKSFDPKQFPKKWLLLLVHEGPCDIACAKNLYYLHQTQIATGKYQEQVARVYIGVGYPLSLAAQKKYPDLLALMSSRNNFLNQHLSGSIFLGDPQGNIILAYSSKNDQEDLYKDLMHLLEVN